MLLFMVKFDVFQEQSVFGTKLDKAATVVDAINEDRKSASDVPLCLC